MGRREDQGGRECIGSVLGVVEETGRDVKISKELRGNEKGESSCISAHHVFHCNESSDQISDIQTKTQIQIQILILITTQTRINVYFSSLLFYSIQLNNPQPQPPHSSPHL
jgi:hypothetical protein